MIVSHIAAYRTRADRIRDWQRCIVGHLKRFQSPAAMDCNGDFTLRLNVARDDRRSLMSESRTSLRLCIYSHSLSLSALTGESAAPERPTDTRTEREGERHPTLIRPARPVLLSRPGFPELIRTASPQVSRLRVARTFHPAYREAAPLSLFRG
ncbi:hypothetical protein JZ751_008506 [Albula glossodonta]|uniref:Uncharacterized protein n=1 Tax=Albula glossodonta TaxID=121402 RepID=A0A8T2N8U5_9TELE|nr:hypothetical protein JZ751_008506 [Albula glossodonta]